MENEELISVMVLALLEEPVMHSPVVILHDLESNRVLPIWIGEPEARAIAIAYQGIETSRPLTHGLFAGTLHELGVEIIQIVIERIESSTYYAALCLCTEDGEEIDVDSRPSDAIALALECGAPLFVTKTVLDKAGQPNPFPMGSKTGMHSVVSDAAITSDTLIKKPRRRAPKAKEKFTEEEMTELTHMLKKARAREYEE
jgi:bifunctional DNase/RNase